MMNRLSDECRQVLSVAQFNARAPLPEVARRAELTEAKVERVLSELLNAGTIYPVCRVSYSALGYGYHVFWVKIDFSERDRYTCLVDSITQHPNIAWASSCSADFDLEIGVISSSLFHAHDVISSLGVRFSRVCSASERYFISFESITLRKKEQKRREMFYTKVCKHLPRFDPLDIQLTEELQKSPLMGLPFLATSLDREQHEVEERLLSLQTRGVLLGTHYRVHAPDCGMTASRILLTRNVNDPTIDAKIRAFANSYEAITSLSRLSGDYDFDLSVLCRPQELRGIVDLLQCRFRDQFRKVIVIPLESTLKSSLTSLTRAVGSVSDSVGR